MERRGDSEPNLVRAAEIGKQQATNYLAKPDAIKDINADSRGQLQLVLTDLILNMTVIEAVNSGLRMNTKPGELVNDLTILGEVIGGVPVFEGTDFIDRAEREFITGVVGGIREALVEAARHRDNLN
jgi:hypothetical protein